MMSGPSLDPILVKAGELAESGREGAGQRVALSGCWREE